MTKKTVVLRSMLLGSAGLILLGTVAGCAQIGDALRSSTTDAWSVSYRVSADAPQTVALHEVSYLDQSARGKAATWHDTGKVSTVPSAGDAGNSWESTAMIDAQKTAGIRASAPDGVQLHCQILLDGVKEIASATAEPGQPVSCEAKTPAFDSKTK